MKPGLSEHQWAGLAPPSNDSSYAATLCVMIPEVAWSATEKTPPHPNRCRTHRLAGFRRVRDTAAEVVGEVPRNAAAEVRADAVRLVRAAGALTGRERAGSSKPAALAAVAPVHDETVGKRATLWVQHPARWSIPPCRRQRLRAEAPCANLPAAVEARHQPAVAAASRRVPEVEECACGARWHGWYYLPDAPRRRAFTPTTTTASTSAATAPTTGSAHPRARTRVRPVVSRWTSRCRRP